MLRVKCQIGCQRSRIMVDDGAPVTMSLRAQASKIHSRGQPWLIVGGFAARHGLIGQDPSCRGQLIRGPKPA